MPRVSARAAGSDESEQPLAFSLSGYDAALFATEPVIGGDGRLTFVPAENQYGETTVTVTLSDGIDAATQTFTLTVAPVNDEPSFVKGRISRCWRTAEPSSRIC